MIFLSLILFLLPSIPLLYAQTCTIITQSPSQVKLLQQNGTVDYLTTFAICATLTTTTALPIVSATTTSEQVLPLSSVSISTVDAPPCRNITASFVFDAMVGQAVYTLTASTDQYSCITDISFLIIGFTIFDTVPASSLSSPSRSPSTRTTVPNPDNPSLVNVILSGENNNIQSDYREILQRSTRAFKVTLQFPDGSDSTTQTPNYLKDSLSTLKAVAQNNAASPVQVDQDTCQIVRDQLTESLDDSACGAAFAQQDDDLSFALRYKPYRDGISTFLFNWPLLTGTDPDLVGESYENFLSVQVTGDPPPIITSIEPKRQFYRAGGEEITVLFDNVDGTRDRKLRVGDLAFPEVPGSFRRLPNGLYEAKYITEPGKGTNLEWTIEVSKTSGDISRSELVDDAEDEKISFTDVPLSIDKIDPPYAREGQTITLTGYFDQFDPTRPEHEIFLGNKPLSELGIIPNVTEDTISFFIPARDNVGAAYEFPITLVMNDEETDNNEFAYIPEERIEVTIKVYGTSYNSETDEYSMGQCDVTDYEANLPSGLSDPNRFQWEMYQQGDEVETNLLTLFPDVAATERQLRLPPKVFGERTGSFEVSVSCEVQGIFLDATVVVLKTEAPVIGVTLSAPRKRTLSTPNVPVRIDALIFPPDPDCFAFADDQEVVFEWFYGKKKYTFTSLEQGISLQVDSPRVSRLGREFIIPQSELQFGNLSVSLFTFVEAATSVNGESSIIFSVVPSDMVPIIGFGSSRILHSSVRSLQMTGERSFNPDEGVRKDIGVEAFKWTCRIANTEDGIGAGQPCKTSFLPNDTERSFKVLSNVLKEFRDQAALADSDSEAGIFYLQYSLSVGSVFGMSDPSFQVVVVLPGDKDVASLETVTISDNRGNTLDWRRVPVSEDIVIVPEGNRVSWQFDIIDPPSGAGILNDSKSLIIVPDYFDPNNRFPLTTALGFRAGALDAAQEYEIAITVFPEEDGRIPGEVRIRIRTLDLPKLILPELPLTSGDLKTTFSAAAKVNLDSTYDFVFAFFLVSADGEEYCLDGCSGRPTVQFRVVQTGIYKVLVRVRDMQGAAVLAEKFFSKSLSVTASSSRPSASLSNLRSLLTEAYRTGDHGSLELLAGYLPVLTRSQNPSSSEIDVVIRVVTIMHALVQNSSPDTASSKSYAKTASRLASVNVDDFSSGEIMYLLFSMVHKALVDVSSVESLDLEDELRAFYNFSARHVFRAFAGSSSRGLKQASEFELGARSLLLDMFILQQEHLTIAMTRDAYCGDVRHVDTIIQGGVSASEIQQLIIDSGSTRARELGRKTYDFVESYEQPASPTFSTVTIGVLCTPRQVIGIRGEASDFTWCEDASEAGFSSRGGVYRMDPSQKKVFMLVETMDFVAMSGLVGDAIQTDSSFLVTANMTKLGSDGLKSFPFPKVDGCLSLNMSMTRLGVTASRGCLSAVGFVVNGLRRPFTSTNAVDRLYRNFSSITSTISRDRSSTILIASAKPGVFGAVGRDCPVNARKPTITPPLQDVEFAYLVFGGAVVAVVGVTVTWVATSTSYVGSVGAAAAAA